MRPRTCSSATGTEIAAAVGDLVGEADRKALSGAYGDYIAGHMRTALRTGSGLVDDDVAFISDWGFDLAAIRVPVTVWWGGDDRFVPHSHGRWLADHVAAAKAEMRPAEGHLSLELNHYGEVLEGLLAADG